MVRDGHTCAPQVGMENGVASVENGGQFLRKLDIELSYSRKFFF